MRYVCHVGHAYSPETLVDAKMMALEPVLWTALRALEEKSARLRRMAERATSMQLGGLADGCCRKADETQSNADALRTVLVARWSAPDLRAVANADEAHLRK